MLRILYKTSQVFLLMTVSIFSFADNPCDETSFSVCEGSVMDTNNQTAGPTTISAYFCGSSENTVWSTFIASGSGNASLNTFGSNYDTQMAAYQYIGGADPCTDIGGYVEIDCNDDAIGLQSEINLNGLNPGETYYVAIDGFGGSSGNLVVSYDPSTASATAAGPNCFSQAEIPTLSEWGLISLALLLMILGSIKLTVSNTEFASFGSSNVSTTIQDKYKTPFDWNVYFKSLTVTVGLALIGFFACFILFGEIFSSDLIGVAFAGPLFAYLLHLLYLIESNKKN